MDHKGPGCISNILFEKHMEVVQQTHIQMQMPPFHPPLLEALLLCQVVAVPWRVFFFPAEQVLLTPVNVFNTVNKLTKFNKIGICICVCVCVFCLFMV